MNFRKTSSSFIWCAISLVVLLIVAAKPAMAIDPPKDVAASAYNFFEGGGITVQGPALIVRKALRGKTAIEAGSRIDMVSSASIDVVTQASPFSEERKENHIGLSHIFNNTLVSSTYTLSDEPDYSSNNIAFALTHDLLDGNLTVHLRYARSEDKVGKNSDPAFGEKDFGRSTYALSLTRLLTARWLVQVNYELTADQGFLNNPYRSVLIAESNALAPENYPGVRTGQAWLIRTGYALPGGGTGQLWGSLQLEYGYYRDTFGIQSHKGKIHYQHAFSRSWRFGAFYRYYSQTAATFYGNRVAANQIFKARDKELSTFTDHAVGGSIRFEPNKKSWGWIQNPYFKAGYSLIFFDYADFEDPRNDSLYSWEANVFQASFGFNY